MCVCVYIIISRVTESLRWLDSIDLIARCVSNTVWLSCDLIPVLCKLLRVCVYVYVCGLCVRVFDEMILCTSDL